MLDDNANSKKIPEKFKKYIFYSYGSFSVKNDRNNVLITFGRFKSEDIACAAVNLLIKNDWDMFEVANDLVSLYLDETYVFKVINNNLIFDSKFRSYEEAVEYVEINSRCNDYHNDVLSKKKRKPKYSNLAQDILMEYKEIPNIFSEKNYFVVKYVPKGRVYGVFNSVNEAIVARNFLIENDWTVSDSVEMKFYDSVYWIFIIENNVLYFIDKFESYEDALDCFNLIKSNKFEDKGLNFWKSLKNSNDNNFEAIKKKIHEIRDNYEEFINADSKLNSMSANQSSKSKIPKNTNNSINRKFAYELELNTNDSVKSALKRKKKKKKINRPQNLYYIPRIKHNITRDNIKIKKLEEINEVTSKIDFEKLKSEFHIIQFHDNVLKDYYSISFSNLGEIKFSSNIQQFKELEYVLRILIVYGWNLSKINELSSIHYFNGSYYVIKSFNGKLIVSGEFESYGDAEENIEFLYDYYSSSGEVIPDNTQKHGDYYKYIGMHNDKNFEINYQKSLETLKAIIDIFNYYDWDCIEFSDYNIYYYHGIYWLFECFNFYIKLKGRFYSKEDAIKHKLNH